MYVVTATSFEYNDETHRVSEGGAGTPVAIFIDKNEAHNDARYRTIHEFLLGWGGDNIETFGYETGEIFSRKPKCVGFNEDDFFRLDHDDLRDALDIKSRSIPDLEDMADCLAFAPYDVVEAPFRTK